MASPRGALPRLHIPTSDPSTSHHAQSQPHGGPFTPSSTVLSLGSHRYGGPQTAGPSHQRFGSIQVPVRRPGELGGGPLPSAGLVPSSPFGGGPTGWGGGGPMPMTAAASSFPSGHQQMASISGGGGQIGRFARLRQGHGRTQSIGPPPKAALGGAGVYTSVAKAQALTPSSDVVPPAPTEPAPPKKKKVVVKLPPTADSDEPALWSRTAGSVEGDGGPRTRSLGKTLEPETASREVSPEEEPQGELVSLDVYLPGKRFWKVMQEERIQARLAALGVVETGPMSPYAQAQTPFSHLSPFGSPHPLAGSPSSLSGHPPRLPSPLSNPSSSPVSNLSPGQRNRPLPPHLLPTLPHNPYFPRIAETQPGFLAAPPTQTSTRLNPAQAPFVPPGANGNRLNPAQTPFVPRSAVHAAPFVPTASKAISGPHPVFTSPFRQDPVLVFGHESVSEDTEGEEEEARISANEEEEGERRLDNNDWEEDVDEELLEAVRLEAGEDTAGLGTAKEANMQMPMPARQEVDEGGISETEEDEVRVGDMAGFGDEEEEEGGEAYDRREREQTARALTQPAEDSLSGDEPQEGGADWDDASDFESRSDGEYSNPSDEDRHLARQAARQQTDQPRHLHTSTFGARRRLAEVVSNPSDEEDEDEQPSALRNTLGPHVRQPSYPYSIGTGSGTGTLSPTKSSGTGPSLNPQARPFSFGQPATSAPTTAPHASTFDPRATAFDPSSIRRTSNPSVFNTVDSAFSRTPTYFTADEGSPRNPAHLIPSTHPVPSTLRGPFNLAASEFRPFQAVAQINSQRSSVDLSRPFTFSTREPTPPDLAPPPQPQRAFGSVSRPLPIPPLSAGAVPPQGEAEEVLASPNRPDRRPKQPTDELLDGTSLASRRAFHSPHASPERPLQVLAGGDIDRLESFKMPVGAVVPVEVSPDVKFKAFKMPINPAGRTPTSPDKARFLLGLTLADGMAPTARPSSSVGREDENVQTLLLPPPPAPANTVTSLNSAGDRFRRAPIPMFGSATAPLAGPASPARDANTRSSVRPRLESRDVSHMFHHEQKDSMDDSLSNMSGVPQRDASSQRTTTWEDEIEDASLSPFAGRAARQTSVEVRTRSSSDALPPGEMSRAETNSPAVMDELLRRIQILIDDKLTSLRTSDVTGGFVHLSTLHPDAEDALVARIVGTLLEERLEADEEADESNGIDVDQVRTVVEDGYRAVCERVEGSIVEALRNLDLPTSSSLASLSLGQQDVAALQNQASRSHQLLQELLTQAQDASTQLAAPVRDATLVQDLAAALGLSMASSRIDIASLSAAVAAALSPLLDALQVDPTSTFSPDDFVNRLLPYLDGLRTAPVDGKDLALQMSSPLSDLLAERLVQGLSEKIESVVRSSASPPFDVASLVKNLAATLPSPVAPVDLSEVHSRLEDLSAQISHGADVASGRDGQDTSALQDELAEAKAALRESKTVTELASERSKSVEAERDRLAAELEASRTAGMAHLQYKAETDLAKVRSDHSLVELQARLQAAEEERGASLGREKLYKKEDEDRAKEHAKLKLRAQLMENELDQAKKTIGINQRTWAQFQSTTTDQLSAITKTIAAAEARAKDEATANKDEIRKLAADNTTLEKKLNAAEEKLTAQLRAGAAATASSKQAHASLSQELDRRVREVEAVREELSIVRGNADASEEEVQGLRAALQEREGRLAAAETSERSLRSNLREAEQSIRSLQADLIRHRSSRTPTASVSASTPSWSNYASSHTPVNGNYAPSSVGSPSAVVHRLQQQVLTPPGSNFRHPPLPSVHSFSGSSGREGYFFTPTRGGGGGGGPGMGKGASGSMHAPVPARAGTAGMGGRGPSATPISRVGTVKPPESEDGWWGEE